MTEREERDLRERFAALRLADGATAPVFQHTVAAARARPPRRGTVLTVAAAFALVVLVVMLAVRSRHRPDIDLAGVRVHAPTDFLLQLPGAELLRTVPRLGGMTLDRRIL
jgi:hypothetical protein